MATESVKMQVVPGDGQLSLVIEAGEREIGVVMPNADTVNRLIDDLIDGLVNVWPKRHMITNRNGAAGRNGSVGRSTGV